MTFYSSKGDRVPDHIHDMAKQAREGKVDRREFLALATAFGASTAMAYGMLGLAVPMEAKAQEPKKGGVLKSRPTSRRRRIRAWRTGRKSPMRSVSRLSRW